MMTKSTGMHRAARNEIKSCNSKEGKSLHFTQVVTGLLPLTTRPHVGFARNNVALKQHARWLSSWNTTRYLIKSREVEPRWRLLRGVFDPLSSSFAVAVDRTLLCSDLGTPRRYREVTLAQSYNTCFIRLLSRNDPGCELRRFRIRYDRACDDE